MIAIDFGRWDDTQQTMTTFVWSSSEGGAPPVVPVAQVVNSSIDEWYAIDYRQKRRRRKLTPFEWSYVRQVLEIWRRSEKKYMHELGVRERLERQMSKSIFTSQHYTEREAHAKRIATQRQASHQPAGVRQRVRQHSDRAAHPRGPGREVWRT